MDESEEIMRNPKETISIRGTIALICLLFFSAIPKSFASQIPVTTSSKEALQLFMQGRDKMANVQLTDAVKLFDQAIEKDPNFALAYLFKAMSSNNYNVRHESLQKAREHSENISPGEKLLIEYAQASFDRNTLKEKTSIDQLLQGYSDDKWVQQIAGQFYFGQSDYRKALTHFNETIKLDADFAPAYNMIGYTQSMLNNLDEAEQAFETYINLVPDNPNPYDSYAELLLKMGKYDESIEQYQKALAIDPNFVSSLLGIGNNYLFKGDYSKAREYYNKEYNQATTVPQKMSALYWNAVSYVHEGKTDQAIQAFAKERKMAMDNNLTPNVIGSYLTSGMVLSHTGNYKEGLNLFSEATKVSENSSLSEPVKNRAMIGIALGKSYNMVLNNKLTEAMKEATIAKKLIDMRQNPNDMKQWNFVMAIIQMKSNNNDQALSYIRKADKESPLTWYYKAMIYEKMGNKEKSAEIYGKINKHNVNSLDLALVRNNSMQKMKDLSMHTNK